MDDVPILRAPAADAFQRRLAREGLQLAPRRLHTLQVNLTKRCNQACRHCHVDASPARSEEMSAPHVARLIEILATHAQIAQLDLTGGAPELHPQFEHLVREATRLGRRVIVRHNLTVQLDPHPVTGASLAQLPSFFAAHGVEVVSSLPCYSAENTDAQRGKGVFAKSIEALRQLNTVGYGMPGSGLMLTLVYNPVGPHLPPPQARLQADYQHALKVGHGLQFNRLITITNMPIHRFALQLRKQGQLEAYQSLLESAFNPAAAGEVMCRDLISVDHDGHLYDCDFNQQLGLRANDREGALTLGDFNLDRVQRRAIRFASHCFGCTAGAGSSCGGATT